MLAGVIEGQTKVPVVNTLGENEVSPTDGAQEAAHKITKKRKTQKTPTAKKHHEKPSSHTQKGNGNDNMTEKQVTTTTSPSCPTKHPNRSTDDVVIAKHQKAAFHKDVKDANLKKKRKKPPKRDVNTSILRQDGVEPDQYATTNDDRKASRLHAIENPIKKSTNSQGCIQATTKSIENRSAKKRAKKHDHSPRAFDCMEPPEDHNGETILEAKHRLASRSRDSVSAQRSKVLSASVPQEKRNIAQPGGAVDDHSPRAFDRVEQTEDHNGEAILEGKHRLASPGVSAQRLEAISTSALQEKCSVAQSGDTLAHANGPHVLFNSVAENDAIHAKRAYANRLIRADTAQRCEEGSMGCMSPGAHRIGGRQVSEDDLSSNSLSAMEPEVLIAATLVQEDTPALAEPLHTNVWVRLAFIAAIVVVLTGAMVSGVMVLGGGGDDVNSDTVSDIVVAPVLTGRWNPLDDPVRGTSGNEFLGVSLAISVDGNIFAAGAPGSNILSGSLNVFRRSSKGKFERMGNQQELRGASPGDMLGFSIALSRDGLTVAGGAISFGEVSINLGYVIVARFNDTAQAWQVLGEPILGEVVGEQFGNNVDLSDDGNIVVIGAPFNNNNGFESGQVKVFKYNGVQWEPLGSAKHGSNPGDEFGMSVAINGEGTMIAVGAHQYRAQELRPGYTRVFQLAGEESWVQLGDDLVGESLGDEFGWVVSLSRSGTTMAVSSWKARSLRGAVQVYSYHNDEWELLGQPVFGKNPSDEFGCSVSLSEDATTLAVGSWREDATLAQPIYTQVFRLGENRTQWQQLGNITERVDPQGGALYVEFGLAVALSGDGKKLATGSMYDVSEDGKSNAGAVTVYQFESVNST
mmetsp:Transcript_285/g.601  ORF Transcript_285/g.601 Transcript_285/m.601 type:complete len:859 (-) Transcript_285:3452-6028(-)